MKRKMYEVKVDEKLKTPAVNIGFTKIDEYVRNINFKMHFKECNDDIKSIQSFLLQEIHELDSLFAKHNNYYDNVIIFHRNTGKIKQIFVLMTDNVLGTPIHWLD